MLRVIGVNPGAGHEWLYSIVQTPSTFPIAGSYLVQHGRGRGAYTLLPEREFADYQAPEPSLPRSPGHHAEWVAACKAGGPTGTSFDYAGPLTEVVLLGNLALRAGRKVAWDAASMRLTDGPTDDPFLRRAYREGWAL